MATVEINSRLRIQDGALWKGDRIVTDPFKLSSLDYSGDSRGLDGSWIEHFAVRSSSVRLRRVKLPDGTYFWDTGSASIPEVEKSFRELERNKAVPAKASPPRPQDASESDTSA